MIVKVLELDKDKARLSIQGEGHTFMNALVEEILRDPDVDVARYVIEFQFSDPGTPCHHKRKEKSSSYHQKGVQTYFQSLQRAHKRLKKGLI